MNKVLGELSITQMTSWIGLFTTQNSGTNYFWVDDSAVDFTNWEEGEPNGNGAFGTELCIQAYAHNGKWNDASCTDRMAYICKIPKSKFHHQKYLSKSVFTFSEGCKLLFPLIYV